MFDASLANKKSTRPAKAKSNTDFYSTASNCTVARVNGGAALLTALAKEMVLSK